MGPQFVREFRTIMSAIEADEQVRVAIFDSAVDGFFLNHSDFYADFADLKSIPQGPTGLEAWPDIIVRLTRVPVVSIASIRGRPTGNGTELALACDMTFVSREKAVLSQWEVGVGNGAFGTRDYQVDAGLNSTQLLSAPIDTYVRTSRSTVQVNLRTWDSVCVSTRGRE
jgi:enoyl-CoA hydratase/carnithine racemase